MNHPYWLSWWASAATGPFTLHTPWWFSGFRDEGEETWRSVCAAVMAESEEDARAQVVRAHDRPPEAIPWRFCEERPEGWSPFSDRFQRGAWMQWPPAEGSSRRGQPRDGGDEAMIFRCWEEGEGDPNGGDVEANSAERAAERYAEDYFNGYAESPKDIVVLVREPLGAKASDGDGRIRRFEVEAEYVVNFIARERQPREESK